MRWQILVAFGAACLALLASPARATLPIGTLVFTTPTGTVGSHDDIPVYLTLTLDAASVPMIATDYTVLSGFDAQDFADIGFGPGEYFSSQFSESLDCNGTAIGGCSGSPYGYDFNYIGSLASPQNFDLEPGQSLSFLFITLHPHGGTVAAGSYSIVNAQVTVAFFDTATSGYHNVPLFDACADQSNSCAFTRTVIASPGVPEPESWSLMIAGFGAAGIAARRARTRAAA